MATVKVQHEGNEIEVPLPEGYVHESEIGDKYVKRDTVNSQYVLKTEMERRFKEWIPKDKALEDPDIVSSIVSKHKPTGKAGDVDLEAAKAEWKRAELEPLKTFSDRLLNQVRSATLKEAAQKAGFGDQHVTSPVPGIPSYVETAFTGAFEYDAELGYFVAKDAAGNRMAAQEPTTARPYAGPEEFFKQLAKQDAWKPYLKPPEKNNGSGYTGGATVQGSAKGKRLADMTNEEKMAYIKETGDYSFEKIQH